MLYLVHRVTISIKLRLVKLEQAVSESLPHKGLYTELLGVQLTCLDPVPASIRARNAQEINITNCDVTSWSWAPGMGELQSELSAPPHQKRCCQKRGDNRQVCAIVSWKNLMEKFWCYTVLYF